MLRWFRKTPEPDKEGRTPADRMLTLHRAAVYYLPITKCGSTYMKNLFHYLDNGFEHESGANIHHRSEVLVRASDADNDKIRQSNHAFTVLRHPVDRFVSLYFDKIWGEGPRNFADIRAMLANDIGLDLGRDLTAETHRENCRKFISWLDQNLAFKTKEPVNPHWRRQAARLKRVQDLNIVHLTLDGLDWQLPMLIGDLIPDIETAMSAVKEKNRIPRPVSSDDLLDNPLRLTIETVYARDLALYQKADAYWKTRRGS